MNKTKKSESIQKGGFLDRTDAYFDKRLTAVFLLSLFGLILFSFLLFQANISTGGDDSFYIIRAQQFIQDGTYPAFQGPLYPLFLAPFIVLFGLNVPLLKLMSIGLTTVFFILFYLSFRKRVTGTVMALSLLTIALNYHILYYASQTYSEAFYLFVQMLFLWQFFRIAEKAETGGTDLKRDYPSYLLLGFILLLLSLSKNIGLTGIISVSAYFIIRRNWKSLLYSVFSWASFTGLYEVIKRQLMSEGEAQISKQGLMLLYKDPYDFSKGKEDLAGFISRFLENSNIYLSKNLMKIFNLRASNVTDSIEIVTILLATLIIAGLIMMRTRSRYAFFSGLYTAITLGVIFVILQTRWDQDRLIFLIVPPFVLFFYSVVDHIIRNNRFKLAQPIYLLLIFLYLSSAVMSASGHIDLISLKKNLAGDKYLGYTPDWKHFLKMSEWCGNNLPPSSIVASRKAAMSSIYANGKKFFNISRVISEDADTLLDHLQQNGVTHVIMAKLRRNPNQKSEYTINTIDRFLYYIEVKYPGTFRLIHQEGVKGDEESILFEADYSVRERTRTGN